jgi:hypothetical protein
LSKKTSTHRFPAESFEQALDAACHHERGVVKVVLKWGQGDDSRSCWNGEIVSVHSQRLEDIAIMASGAKQSRRSQQRNNANNQNREYTGVAAHGLDSV